MDPASLASSFNSGYAMAGQTRRHRLFTEILGIPIEVEPNSFVTMELFTRIARELRVGPGDRLVDLACGRGGPGLLLASLTGVDLVGVDFSEVAVAHARQRTALFVPEGRATFNVGELAATGLGDGCADAVVCIDSVQFAPDRDAAFREAHRVLRPGGRYVQTNWEARDPTHPGVPAMLRTVGFAQALRSAGFTHIVVEDRPDLGEVVTTVFRAAMDMDPADDEPMRRLREEAAVVLDFPDTIRRVVVIAERP